MGNEAGTLLLRQPRDLLHEEFPLVTAGITSSLRPRHLNRNQQCFGTFLKGSNM
jgi:hypothetical protein